MVDPPSGILRDYSRCSRRCAWSRVTQVLEDKMQPEERSAYADAHGRVSSVLFRRVEAHRGIPHPQRNGLGGPIAHCDLRVPKTFVEGRPEVKQLQPPLDGHFIRDVPARAHAERHTAELLPRGERGAARYTALGYEVELGESQACHPFDLERGGSTPEALRAGDAEVSVAQLGVVMDLLRPLKSVPGQGN